MSTVEFDQVVVTGETSIINNNNLPEKTTKYPLTAVCSQILQSLYLHVETRNTIDDFYVFQWIFTPIFYSVGALYKEITSQLYVSF